MTALASCEGLVLAAEGPFLRFYNAKTSQLLASERIFNAQAIHGISVYSERHNGFINLVIWGGRLVRPLRAQATGDRGAYTDVQVRLSEVGEVSDWILDLAPRPSTLDEGVEHQADVCAVYAAVTAHNAIIQVDIEFGHTDTNPESRYGTDRLRAQSQQV